MVEPVLALTNIPKVEVSCPEIGLHKSVKLWKDIRE